MHKANFAKTVTKHHPWLAVLLLLLLPLVKPQSVAAQALPQDYDVTEQCFGVADEGMNLKTQKKNFNDTLVRINRTTGITSIIGATGTLNIEAIAFDSNETLYAADAGQLGTLDLKSGKFTPKPSSFGTANGSAGPIPLNDVDGLFYDTFNQTLYGVQRRETGTDLLFKINPETGEYIRNAFPNNAGYVEIANVTDSHGKVLDDVDDIAVDPNDRQMYGAINNGGSGGLLIKIETDVTKNPGATTIMGEFRYVTGPLTGQVVDDIEGLSFFNDGQLYGSTGNNGPDNNDRNQLFRIDMPTVQPTTASTVVTTTRVGAFPSGTMDFEALACLTAKSFINLRAFVNGPGQTPADTDAAPGLQIPTGAPVTWTYVMTNTGVLTLTDISLIDDRLGSIGPNGISNCPPPAASLKPGGSLTCVATGYAKAGPYANMASVTAQTQVGVIFPRQTVTDVNASHYFGAPGLIVKKLTNDQDADVAPGPAIPVGSPVTWTYKITNTTFVPLTNITLNDDKEGMIPCLSTPLNPQASVTCSRTGIAQLGLYRNLATVTGTPTLGPATPLTNTDPSYYTGIDNHSAAINGMLWFDQNGNGHEPDLGEQGMATVTVELRDSGGQVLRNTQTNTDGIYNFTGLAAGDYIVKVVTATLPLPVAPTYDPDSPPLDQQATVKGLTIGESRAHMNFGYCRQCGVIAGRIWADDDGNGSLDRGLANVDVQLVGKGVVTTNAAGYYTFTQLSAGLYTIKVVTPTLPPGAQLISDPVPPLDQMATINLAEGEHNTALNFGYLSGPPKLLLQKRTNGQPVAAAPGPFIIIGEPVTWSYTVTNTGGRVLKNLHITDDNGTPANAADDISVCELPELPLKGAEACFATRPAQAGQYSNIAIATADALDGGGSVTASDVSYYFGIPRGLILKTFTNEQDADELPGPTIVSDTPITWRYVVTNTRLVALRNIRITDDNGTPADLGDDLNVCVLPELAPNQSGFCTAPGVAKLGQYGNIGTATGEPIDGSKPPVAQDASHYLGVHNIMALKILTNGQDAATPPGPSISAGAPVIWTYYVTNTGNVFLKDVVVADDNGTPNNPADDMTPCRWPLILPGQSAHCDATGQAILGQYGNIGTATGQPVDARGASVGVLALVRDASHYLGVPDPNSILRLTTSTNDDDANDLPGPKLVVSDMVTWTYAVTNVSGLPVRDIQITDHAVLPSGQVKDTPVCKIVALSPNEATKCTVTGMALLGQYANVGLATGQPVDANGAPVGNAVTVTDPSHYLGILAKLPVTPHLNGLQVAQPPGLCVQAPSSLFWSYTITNSGDGTITNIRLVDDQIGSIRCPLITLASGQAMTCTAITSSNAGAFSTTSTVTGQPVDGNGHPLGAQVHNSAPSYYIGWPTSATLEKKVNGVDADTANLFWIFYPGAVNFTYAITNTGSTVLTDLAVTDSDNDLSRAIQCQTARLGPGETMQCAATLAAVDHALQSDGIFTAQPVDDQNNRCGAPLRLTHPAGYTGRRDSIKLVLQPEEAQLDVGTGHTLIATASMSDTGKPITDTLVHFAVNGLNHAVGISKTDSSGQATFAYFGGVNITVTNQLTETDQISAWIDLNNDQQLQLGTEPVASTIAIWHRIDVGICHDEGGTAETPLRHLTVKVTRYPEDPKANCERPTHPVIGAEVNLLVTDGTAYGPEAKRITDTGVVNFTYVSNAPQAAAGQARTLRAAAADTVQPGAILSPTQATGNTDLVSVWVELNQNRRLDPTEPFDLAEVSTAVQLVAFTAQVEGAAVVLRWTTAVEIDNAGYNLYRSSTLDGEYAQVNAQFIGAQGEGYGATYQFVDTPPASGQYFYKLVAISNRNVRTIYPPQPIQFAPQPPGNLANLLYLPLIQR